MATTYTSDEHKLDVIHQLSKAAAFISDPKGLERHVVELLKKLVPSNAVLIFRDNRDQQYLVAANPYNLTQEEKDSIVIPYDDQVAQDILVHRKSLKRRAADDPILPLMNAELFVPLVSPNHVFGCIYLSRLSSKPFEAKDVKLVEHAAFYLTIALERQQWGQQFNEMDRANLLWQNHYIAILDALPFPAAIIELKENRFDEVNQRMLDVLNIDQMQFIDQRLSDFFSVPNWETVQTSLVNLDTCRVELPVRDKPNVSLHLQPVRLFEDTDTKLLLLFREPDKTAADGTATWLKPFIETFVQQPGPSKTELHQALSILIHGTQADYLLYLPQQDTAFDQQLVLERRDDTAATPEPSHVEALTEMLRSVEQKDQPVTIITDLKSQFPKQVDAVNVSSLVKYRVDTGLAHQSNLGIFFIEPVDWSGSEDSIMQACVVMLSQTIQKRNLAGQLKTVQTDLDTQRAFSKTFARASTFNSLIEQGVMELNRVFSFDYMAITLLNDQGQQTHSLHIAAESLKSRLKSNTSWTRISDSSFGIVDQPVVIEDNPGLERQKPRRLPYTLPIHTSVLLMGRDQYLGNCAVGRSSQKPFSDDEMHLLRQWSALLGPDIQRTQTESQMQDFVQDVQAIQSMFVEMEPPASFKALYESIRTAAHTYLGFNHLDIVPIHQLGQPRQLFSWLPKSITGQFSDEKCARIPEKITSQPCLCIDTLELFLEHCLDEEADPDPLTAFKPFLLAPIRFDKRLHAILVIAWGDRQHFPEYRDIVLPFLIRQIESLQHTINLDQDWKHKTSELESLIYSISHDLKTPIQSVRSFITMLTQEYGDYLPEEPQQFILRMMNNLDYMEKLVFDLLELSRINKRGRELVEVNVTEIVQSVIQSMQGLITEHNVSIEYDDLPTIQSDPTLLTQIFSNLLSNAVKFSRQQTNPRIKIIHRLNVKTHQFTVLDNGIGIANDLHDKIFQVFQTEHKNDDDHSTGVGLAIVKRAVETLGGHIQVESKVGNGAAFRFTVPETE